MIRIIPESTQTINTKYIFNRRKAAWVFFFLNQFYIYNSLNNSDFRGNVKSSLKYGNMARQFYRRKHKNRPKLPKDCGEIKRCFADDDILKKYGFTLDGKFKLYLDTIVSANHSFCVFQSQAVMNMVKERVDKNHRRYLLDGTFKSAAKPFKQLLTISAEYKNDVSFYFIWSFYGFFILSHFHISVSILLISGILLRWKNTNVAWTSSL